VDAAEKSVANRTRLIRVMVFLLGRANPARR
jgi:hypothetical protein